MRMRSDLRQFSMCSSTHMSRTSAHAPTPLSPNSTQGPVQPIFLQRDYYMYFMILLTEVEFFIHFMMKKKIQRKYLGTQLSCKKPSPFIDFAFSICTLKISKNDPRRHKNTIFTLCAHKPINIFGVLL